MVFDPGAAPRAHAAFMAWYDEQTRWFESHGYSDPEASAPALRLWFVDMIKDFPVMNRANLNGGGADNPKITEYCIGSSVIYAAFAWSEATAAYKKAFFTAQRHRIGFFDPGVSGGDLWLPNPATGKLKRVHAGEPGK